MANREKFKKILSNEMDESHLPKKVLMAQFCPEPGILVEIPFNMVKTLYHLKLLLIDSKTPESTRKMIDKAKQRCLDNVSRAHPEMTNILNDMKEIEKALEAAESGETEITANVAKIKIDDVDDKKK